MTTAPKKRAPNAALKWMATRIKALRKIHPEKRMVDLAKMAGAEYRVAMGKPPKTVRSHKKVHHKRVHKKAHEKALKELSKHKKMVSKLKKRVAKLKAAKKAKKA
jgi:hypothetical protein